MSRLFHMLHVSELFSTRMSDLLIVIHVLVPLGSFEVGYS
jgi:hypothetical protein